MRYVRNWPDFAGLLRKSITALMLLLALCVLSCRGPKNASRALVSLPGNLVTERLVPVYLPPDSALLTALFECDSNNRVILKAYDELKSQGMNSHLTFEDGRLDYNLEAVHDTVYLPAKDSIVYVPQEVEVIKEVNHITWWQETWIRIGKLSLSILAIWLGLKGVHKLLKHN